MPSLRDHLTTRIAEMQADLVTLQIQAATIHGAQLFAQELLDLENTPIVEAIPLDKPEQ